MTLKFYLKETHIVAKINIIVRLSVHCVHRLTRISVLLKAFQTNNLCLFGFFYAHSLSRARS